MTDQHDQTRQEERITQVSGNRLCIRCGHPLTGQPVVREPHYDMLIIRCAECGAAASMQEYPILSRWSSRFGYLMLGLWFITLIGMLLLTSLAITGFSIATGERAAWNFEAFIDMRFQETNQADQSNTNTTTGTVSGAPLQTSPVATMNTFRSWWNEQDANAMLRDAGGWLAIINWRAIVFLVPAMLVLLAAGVFWSGVLVHWRRRKLAILALLFAIVAAAFLYLILRNFESWNTIFQPWQAAREAVMPTVAWMALITLALVMLITLIVGRTVLRGLVRLLLPRRMQAALAQLWLADGKTTPEFEPRSR